MIIGAKLQLPSIQSFLVKRPSMNEKLNKGLNRKLTILSAPAGYGKTTAVCDWAKQCGAGVAWISLDKRDNDSFRFWNHVTAAVAVLHPEFTESMRPILSEYSEASAERLIAALLDGLGSVSGELIVVLDDYHILESFSGIHDIFAELLPYLHNHIHIYITTRAELPFPTTRLKVKNQVHKISIKDFRFHLDEGLVFFHQCMDIPLSKEDVSLLVQQTEGWVSGLQLAGLSLKENGVDPDFIRKFSGQQRDISDYLLEEVFRHQTEQTQQFLLQTSILNRLNGALCEQVTGQADGQSRLEWLERHNLFVLPLDRQRDWYRYHHLFADFLQRQLRERYSELWKQAHANAARWLENNGLAEDAVDHLIRGYHYSEAVRLIETLLPLLMHSQWASLYSWFTVIPDEYISEIPMIDIFYIGILMGTGRMDQAEVRAERAERHLELSADPLKEDERRHAEGTLHLLQAIIAIYRKDIARASARFERFDRQLPEGSFFQQLGGNSDHAPSMSDMLAFFNDLRLAESFFVHWIQQWEKRGTYPFVGYFMVSYCDLLYEWDRLEEAERFAEAVLRREDMQKFTQITVHAALIAARIRHVKGEPQKALDLLERTKSRIATPDEKLFRRKMDGLRACLTFQQDSGLLASLWLQTSGLTFEDTITRSKMEDYFLLSRVLGLLGLEIEAIHILESLYQLSCNQDCIRDRIRALVMKSILLDKLGRTEEAIIKLELALHLGEPQKYCRIFVDEGEQMAQMLLSYLQWRRSGFIRPSDQTVSLIYVKRLLQVMNANLEGQSFHSLLTEQETRILVMIAKGLSNKEIAAQHKVAAATVQSHIKNIYRKLEVSSRMQALQRAKDWNLL